MTLTPGTRLGAYEVTGKLGEGGMGEVWRATDPRLGREVAIKVLPASLTGDARALARFEAEARAVAALSHPNVLAVHELGREGDTLYLVTELLAGRTLRERIAAEGALPLRETLELGAQIARGLAAAHEKGIVHRDLKPANLLQGPDGRVKILDFGLARQVAEGPSTHSGIAAAPTIGPGTEPGTVLGTVGYMAPEQVRGEPADARSDLFALGVVLYEMATGERAFAGDTGAETMTAILRQEPPRLGVPGSPIPPGLERVIRHCLEKNPRQRFRSGEDLAFALESLVGGSSVELSGGAAAVAGGGKGRRRALVAAAAAALLGAGALGGWLAARRAPAATTAAATADATTTPATFRQLTRLPGDEGRPSLAPDGESFVFVKRDGDDFDLFTQRTDGSKPIPLTADCDADDFDPAFSRDGRWIAFRSECDGGGIFVIGATGEARRRVSDFGYAPAWSPDGRELAVVTERLVAPTSRNSLSELWAVDVDSGTRRRLSERDAMNPTWSPDGRWIAFWGVRSGAQRDLWQVRADGTTLAASAAVALLDDPPLDWAPVYAPDGRWLYFASTRGGTMNLWRLPLDPASGAAAGTPQPLTVPSSWAGPFSLSADGRRLAYCDRNVESEILGATFDPERQELAGAPVPVFRGSFELRDQKVSPAGDWILFANEDMPQHLHLVRPDRSGFRQLTLGDDRNRQGEWSPDGAWIVFQTTRGDSGLAAIRPDGGGWQKVSTSARPGISSPAWSPDGGTIAVSDNEGGAVLLDVRGGLAAPGEEELPPVGPGILFWPTSWSPDGALLAGRSVQAGQIGEIVVYDPATGVYRSIAGTAGATDDFNLVFVGERQVVYTDDRELWLLDLGSGATRRLYQPPAGRRAANLAATRDGRWLTWIERADESDIWLLTLDDGDGGAAGR